MSVNIQLLFIFNQKNEIGSVLLGRPVGKDHLEDPAVDGEVIKMDLKDVGWRSMVWIYLAQDRDRCRALVNVVMNFLFQ